MPKALSCLSGKCEIFVAENVKLKPEEAQGLKSGNCSICLFFSKDFAENILLISKKGIK